MAAFMRHGVFKTGQLVSPKNVLTRTYATKAEKRKGIDRKVGPKIDPRAQSLAAKGFLRAQKEYTPPADVQSKLENIFKSVLGSTTNETKLDDIQNKFKVLIACEAEFNHSVPNSLLHTMETLQDVRNFYNTPIDVRTPLDKMRNMELPENLHIQYDYHRFHPDTDTVFGGKTAFNQSNTIVTGLKYKGKYPGYIQNQKIPI
ncbi:39S ribosomal protein L50, mitochondrial [Anoplophora glabripennis]|uniref:39S ribosomal protein L50, mitochondrial n=1 Tax=Anoplophora glabripennis TaxID=217634 RepID=UPI00087474F5|nr:39S ribosomal protein L50, mitochondrial [Anoplophora glabripennis]